MSVTIERASPFPGVPRPDALGWLAIGIATAVAVSFAVNGYAPWAATYPEGLVVPLNRWLTDLLTGLPQLAIGPVTVGDIAAGLVWLLERPLDLIEGLLFRGFPALSTGPLPWIVVVVIFGIIGFLGGGFRLAALGAGGMLYLALFGLWQLSMETLSLVLLTVPIIAGLGLVLGILCAHRPRLETALSPLFDVLQSTPQIAYLLPIVVFFGLGQIPAVLATVVYAVPAMAKCVIVGLRAVPKDVIEAGVMAGATPRQLLWKVELPAAQAALFVGLNQSIMLTLAMVVIASLIGAAGLGHEVLIQLDRLWLGRALEVGLGIVVLAIVLDRLSRGAIESRSNPAGPARRQWKLIAVASVAAVAAGFALAALHDHFVLPQRELTISTSAFWDVLVKSITDTFYDELKAFRSAALIYFLLPVKRFLLWLPWFAVVACAIAAGWAIGGRRLAVTAGLLAMLPAVTGLWVPTMITVYMLSIALLICLAVGFPIGLLAARSDRLSGPIMGVCDLMQTLPSFIYLVPVVMLFKAGDVSAIAAALVYSIVPVIRYTNLGLRNVPATTKEAAIASGCARLQLLTKVELPIALPEILLGVNQLIMFGLACLSITALVGARDLEPVMYRALSELDPGKGIIAGLCIAALGIFADRFIRTWIARRDGSASA